MIARSGEICIKKHGVALGALQYADRRVALSRRVELVLVEKVHARVDFAQLAQDAAHLLAAPPKAAAHPVEARALLAAAVRGVAVV